MDKMVGGEEVVEIRRGHDKGGEMDVMSEGEVEIVGEDVVMGVGMDVPRVITGGDVSVSVVDPAISTTLARDDNPCCDVRLTPNIGLVGADGEDAVDEILL